MNPAAPSDSHRTRIRTSDRFLACVEKFDHVILVTHPNPDPDALASMLGLEALLRLRHPAQQVTLTLEGIIARAENQAMVDLLAIPLVPFPRLSDADAARAVIVMVDAQPRSRPEPQPQPLAVLDHHDTPGQLQGVRFRDIRPRLGATATLVTGYLLEQGFTPNPRLATALYYGIESEISGYPREAGSSDDGALVWLFPRADKDLLAQIKNPRLPQSYFVTFHHALSHASLYNNTIISWCGLVPQPDIIAELADFFVRFDQVDWALSIGLFEGNLKLSLRADHIHAQAGELLRVTVNGLGSAGGHDKRAGGVIILENTEPATIEQTLQLIRNRFLALLSCDENQGLPLLQAVPHTPQPFP